MQIVKSPEEIARIQKSLNDVRFTNGRMFSVEFETDRDWVKAILPPGLETVDDPKVVASICDFGGGSCGPFRGGVIHVNARHGDKLGNYSLFMFMDSDNALLFGRDLFGEPKKMCTADVEVAGNRVHGAIERGGVRLIEIDAMITQDIEPRASEGYDFNYKCALAIDGMGLQGDPQLTGATMRTVATRTAVTDARLHLNGSIHDPLHEIPVGKTTGSFYIEGDIFASANLITTVPADAFLPYALGRLPHFGAFYDADLERQQRKAG